MNGFFITGTNTDIGKTYFTACWTRYLRSKGVSALALKPIGCGDRSDAEQYAQANEETLTLNEINPVFLLPPLSPYAACVVEERPFDMQSIEETLAALSAKHPGPFLVEGVGGWLVPITRDYWVRDWARELGLPVVIVASAGLGTLNHSLLTVESVRKSGCEIRGIVMNHHLCPDDLATTTNPAVLEDLCGLPVWGFPANADPAKLTWPKWLDL